MAHRRFGLGGVPPMVLAGPLLMLASGLAVGVVLWRYLVLEPPPAVGPIAVERLTPRDQRALDHVLGRRHGNSER